MSYWEITETQRRSFMGRSFRFGTLDGPLELFSFSSRVDRPNKSDAQRSGRREPMYFMTKSNLCEAIGAELPLGKPRLQEAIRQGVALREDWNDMRYVFTLDVPAAGRVQAWFGLAKFQPRCAGRDGTESSLAGGWLQYIIEIDDLTMKWIRVMPSGW